MCRGGPFPLAGQNLSPAPMVYYEIHHMLGHHVGFVVVLIHHDTTQIPSQWIVYTVD